MGNVQVLNPFYLTNDPNNATTSPSGSQIFDFNDDINSAGPNNSSNRENKVLCEYCQEYCFAQFHEEHTRICGCNPANIRTNRWFPFQRSATNTSNADLQKTPCNYCDEPCYLKYKEDHQRICPKNPENIKVNCRYCNKTLNLIMYQTHLDSCEDTHRERRRSANVGPRTERHIRLMPNNLRRSKTNNDIRFKSCERTRPVRVVEKEELECPICLESIKNAFDLSSLNCNHKFHKHCINNWSCVQNKCPICRKEFY